MTTDAPNTTNKSEKTRGFREGSQKIELLRAKWPKAFPAKSHEVRPLTNEAQQAIVEEFGWSRDYARAVLAVWKLRPAYCKAILFYPTRINLDGSQSSETVDDRARATATDCLAQSAASRAKRLAKVEYEKRRTAAWESAKARALETASAAIPEAQPETAAPPEPIQPRKVLVAGTAAMEAALKRRLAGGAMTTEVVKTVASTTQDRRREQRAR